MKNCRMFDDPQINTLADALVSASEAEDLNDNDKIYAYMEDTPKSSFLCEIVDTLNRMGYKIVKK